MTTKPDDCIICYEKLEQEHPLECGHWIHTSCAEKHFKPECPVCRRPLSITVTGTPPEPFIPMDMNNILADIQELHDNIDNYHIDEETDEVYYVGEPNEDDISDEENPYGDEYDYPDEDVENEVENVIEI
jgi:hypothetical protein